MILQLYPGPYAEHAEDYERALDRALDGHHAELLAKRRRNVDASPLACWLDQRVLVIAWRAPRMGR